MKFPETNHPHPNTLYKIVKYLRATGSFKKHLRLSRFSRSTVHTEEVLGYTIAHHVCSVRDTNLKSLNVKYVLI